MTSFISGSARRLLAALLPALIVVGAGVLATRASAAEPPAPGTPVHIGHLDSFGGSAFTFPIYLQEPADPQNAGEPDFWGYCIEHDISYQTNIGGEIGEFSSFVGDNLLSDPVVQGKVLWVLGHGYPSVDLATLSSTANVPGLTRAEALNAMTTAIWRYTDVGFDGSWPWGSPNAETLYWYLVNGANASDGMVPEDFDATVTVTPPAAAQAAGALVGPFVVHTDQPLASVMVDPARTVTDASGTPIDTDAVVDGQEFYLDLRDTAILGSATVTASVLGSGVTGMVVTAPTVDGSVPTPEDHAQSIITVAAPSPVLATATVEWTGEALPVPTIGTSLVDAADGDRLVGPGGGAVIDTVSYDDLQPDTDYLISGELMDQATGLGTGIIGSTAFTSSATGTGTVDVAFVIDGTWAGRTLVAFEVLTLAGDVVATHEDIDDQAQTVVVEDLPTTSTTPTTTGPTDPGTTTPTDPVTTTPTDPGTTTPTAPVPTTSDGSLTTVTRTTTVGYGPTVPELALTGVDDRLGALLAAGLVALALGSLVLIVSARRRTGAH